LTCPIGDSEADSTGGWEMDLHAVLAAVGSWPVEDRLRLVDEIWTGILDQGHEPELTETQMAELRRRLAEDDANPEDVVSWEEVKAAAFQRAGQ
jgi:putative addiction module component (TIGR02574 family)